MSIDRDTFENTSEDEFEGLSVMTDGGTYTDGIRH